MPDINVLGFVTLPAITGVVGYKVVLQSDGRYAVYAPDGRVVSIQPNGNVDFHPANSPLGGYELGTLVPAGLRYDPVPGASYLIAAEQV